MAVTAVVNIEKYTAAAMKRFSGLCESLVATPKEECILFEFLISGVPARLEVRTGILTPTKVRSAFIELGMEIAKLARTREAPKL